MAATKHASQFYGAQAQPQQAAKQAKPKLQLLESKLSANREDAERVLMRYWQAAKPLAAGLGVTNGQIEVAMQVANRRASAGKGLLKTDVFHNALVQQLASKSESGATAKQIHTLLNNQMVRNREDKLLGKVDALLMNDFGLGFKNEARFDLQRDVLLTLTSAKLTGGTATYKQLAEELGQVEGIGVSTKLIHAVQGLQRLGLIATDRMVDERTGKTYTLITISEQARAKLLNATAVKEVRKFEPKKAEPIPQWMLDLASLHEMIYAIGRKVGEIFAPVLRPAYKLAAGTAAALGLALMMPGGLNNQGHMASDVGARAAVQEPVRLATISQSNVSDTGIGMWNFKRDPLHYGFDWNPVVSFRYTNNSGKSIGIIGFDVTMDGHANAGAPEESGSIIWIAPGQSRLLKFKGPEMQVQFVRYNEPAEASVKLRYVVMEPEEHAKLTDAILVIEPAQILSAELGVRAIVRNIGGQDPTVNARYERELKVHAKGLPASDVVAHPQLLMALFGKAYEGELWELHNAGLLAHDSNMLEIVSRFQTTRKAQAGKELRAQFASYVSQLYENALTPSTSGQTILASAR